MRKWFDGSLTSTGDRAGTATRRERERAQTSLPALAIALLLLTVVTGLGMAMADGALVGADRNAEGQRVASSLAERMVAGDSPLTNRANVLNGSELDSLDGRNLTRRFPMADDYPVQVRANGAVVAATGDVDRGARFRRLVVVERTENRTIRPAIGSGESVTLPRRTGRATLTLTPPAGTTVRTVRANDRVVLHNTSGLAGEFTVNLSRLETTKLRFDATGPLPDGSLVVAFRSPRTTKTTLEVTVDG